MQTNPRPHPCRVMVIEPQQAIADLIVSVVASMRGFLIVGQARTAADSEPICAVAKPDLIITALPKADESEEALSARLREFAARCRILIFPSEIDPTLVRLMLACGISAIVSHSATLEEFRTALKAVASGQCFFCSESSIVIREIVMCSRKRSAKSSPNLTKRQSEVWHCVCRGMSTREIAQQLQISSSTVDSHRFNLRRKLGIHRYLHLAGSTHPFLPSLPDKGQRAV